VDLAELELQLKVWKDLAISNQILMRTATDALKLDPDCSTVELKISLDTAIQRSLDADAKVDRAQQQSQQAIAAMEKKIAISDKAQAIAEDSKTKTLAAQQLSEQLMAVERANHIKEQKKTKTQLSDKDAVLKSINKALADTPENVLKKLRTLKKQKSDAAIACKQAEDGTRAIRKEKTQLEQDLKEAEEKFTNLTTQYRSLHKLCGNLHQQLKPLIDDDDDLPAPPELDEEMLGENSESSE